LTPRVPHDRHAYGQRGAGTLAALRNARLYILEANGALDRADGVNGANASEVAAFLAGETLATGYTTEEGATEVTYPLISDAYGKWAVSWHAPGTYDEYCPDDPHTPLRRWEADTRLAKAVEAGNLGAAYELDVEGYANVMLEGTLNANHALTFANLRAGSVVAIAVTQDATGGRTLSVDGASVAVDGTPLSVTILRAYSPDGSTVYVDAPGVDPSIVGAAVTRNTAQSILNNTASAVSWQVETWDTHGFVNIGASADRITIPTGRGGLYAVSWQTGWAINGTGSRYSWIGKNAASFDHSDYRAAASAESASVGYAEMVLAAGDYVQLWVFQNSGGALGLGGVSPYFIWPRLRVRRLGPSPV
jgi:hypothetical protein